MTLLSILDQNHKGLVLKIAKVPIQISFKHSKPLLAFLLNFWPKTFQLITCFQVQQLLLLGFVLSAREITEPFRKIKQWFEIKRTVLKVRKRLNDFSSKRFLQKTNKQILIYYYETSGWLVFVRFLEEIEGTKETFRNYQTFNGYIVVLFNLVISLVP